MKRRDIQGQQFGKLTALEPLPRDGRQGTYWRCRCQCGRECQVSYANLSSGRSRSCGCSRRVDLTGGRYGLLTVLGLSEKPAETGRKARLWICRCDCGAITYKTTDALRRDVRNSCAACAKAYAVSRMRACSGFVAGTQLSRIRDGNRVSGNASGFRGVYYDKRTGRWRARLRFKGKLYSLGTYAELQDAVNARKRGEAAYYGAFLEALEK